MSKEPITVYRLWCGRKRYSGWLPSSRAAREAGLPHKVTFLHDRLLSLGPLAWVEIGQRRYARSKTVTIGREG